MEETYLNIERKISEQYGRYLVAAKDLKQGDVIFKETSLIVGPKIKGDLVCLNCYSVFYKRFHVCSQCKLAPLCGPICEDHRGGHTEAECKKFAEFRGKFTVPQLLNRYHLVTILRCLALQSLDNQTFWNSLMNLESHIDKRKGTSIWDFHETSNKIIQDLGLLNQDDIDSNLVQRICAILDINSFELCTPSNAQGQANTNSVCGIYCTAAMMAHNCVCNTHVSIDDSFVMTIRAAVPIAKGETIYFNYTNSLNGTVERREHLKVGKYFDCCCERCLDGTELNTHMSSVKCKECTTGLIVMMNLKSISQYSDQDKWTCSNCSKEYLGSEIKAILENIIKMIPNIDNEDITQYEDFLLEASQFLPSTHSIMIDVKHKLAGLLRDMMQITNALPRHVIENKLQICKEFLPILNILEPGISRLKAIVLYEMYNPLATLSNMDYDSKEISSALFLEHLEEAEKYLKESIKYLLLEPTSSPEATLCRRAMLELKNLKSNIDAIKILVQEEQLCTPLKSIAFNTLQKS